MKKKMTVLAVLLLAVVTTTYSVSGTYAKYTSTFVGNTDSARVAAWAFEVNDTAATNSFTFNLFDTVKDTKDGNNELDVKVGEGETIIAPGTKGSFDIKLENLSEVNATYAINYTVVNEAGIPIEFSVDGGQTWTADLANVVANEDIQDAAQTVLNMNGGNKTITIQWQWLFEEENRVVATDDAYDTTLGAAGTGTVTVKADVIVTQID